MAIDWDQFENAHYEFARSQIEAFALENANDSFYAFAFCCNAYYAEVLLSLNSERYFRQSVEKSYAGANESEHEELRWSIGDWEFMEDELVSSDEVVNPTVDAAKGFIARIDELQPPAIEAKDTDNESAHDEINQMEQEFLRRMCRVAIRLETDNAFANLKRTPGFTIYVVDHDETDFDSWQRLIRERIAVHPPWNGKPWPIVGRHRQMSSAIFAESVAYREAGKHVEAAHLLREAIARLPELATDASYEVEGTDVHLPLPINHGWARAYAATVDSLGWGHDESKPELLAKAQKFDADYAEIYYLRAKHGIGEAGESLDAHQQIAQLDRAIEFAPNEPYYFGARAKEYRYLEGGDRKQAIRDYSRAHDLEPTNQDWLKERAELYVEEGNPAAAIDDLTKLFSLWNNHTNWMITKPMVQRAECYMQLKDYQSAIEDWTRWINHYQKVDHIREYLLRRAECYRAMNNERDAIADERRAAGQ